MVPGTFTTHEVPLAAALRIRERSEGRVVGETEELMEEGNIVLFRDCLRGARRIAADSAVVQGRPICPGASAAGGGAHSMQR